ncbi:amino acid ABC transporter substrate-binding protein [Corticibacter populi]|uniref:Amino acid ABC transporter substrate-binding protein n=1 Tax=Corticibacter populi TaxID=1550736 RepID=A0A3M6QU40_9BURK|nr:transporter substrate-binding domain-containing protein [Corticibacter populi]RMX06550.1 amino acid ABC transporter substrate-binding protein [Corticibacter populi]RZS31885.1 amino acid ABC transporter substrate-binding protein (PAAT family) [Corticibacter populi]
MKKVLSCISLAVAATIPVMAHADTLAKVASSGEITLAYRESSVPFSYLEGPNDPIGFSVDLAKAVVEQLKKDLNKPDIKIKWQAVTSQNRIPLLVNGTIDLECGSTTNNSARGKDVAFATNHFYTGTRLLVKKSTGITGYADTKGKTITSTTGTTNLQVLRKYDRDNEMGWNLVSAKDHADAFLLVESDRAAAFGMDDILLFGLIGNARNPQDFEVVGESLQVEPYACMLRKDDPKFKTLVDGVINGLMDSGEFTTLYDKWFLQPIPPRNVALGLEMSQDLKDNLKAHSDQPAN